MRIWACVLAFAGLFISGRADAIQIALDVEALVGTPISGTVDLGFADLNGTVLAGQVISADLLFEGENLARVVNLASAVLIVQTNAPSERPPAQPRH